MRFNLLKFCGNFGCEAIQFWKISISSWNGAQIISSEKLSIDLQLLLNVEDDLLRLTDQKQP